MNLCRLQLKNIFGSLLFFFLLLSGLFLITTSASAVDNEHFSWYDNSWGYDNPNFSGTITAGTNQVLFCNWRQARTDTANTIAWHGVSLTTYKSITPDTGAFYSGYLVNPDVGTYNITNPSGGYISGVTCIVKENVNQSQPVDFVSDNINGSSASYLYTLSSSTPSVILNYFEFNAWSAHSFDTLTLSDTGQTVGQGAMDYIGTFYTDTATSTLTITPLSNGNINFFITELNKVSPSPVACTEFIWSDYGECINGYHTRTLLSFSPSGCFIDYQNNPPGEFTTQCNDDIQLYLPYNWRGILFENGQEYYQRFQYLYNKDVISSSTDYIKMYRCSNSSCTGTTTPVVFTNGFATSTELSITQPFGVSNTYEDGASMFVINQPLDIGTSTTQLLYYKFIPYYDCSLGFCVQGVPAIRSINWQTVSDGGMSLSSSDNPNIIDDTEIEDDLANASSTDDLKDKTLVASFFSVGTDFLRGLISPFLFTIKGIFPFNMVVILIESWTDSASMSLPSDITIFNSLDNNGNISISLPVASSSLLVFGPGVLMTETITAGYYSSVRSFSTYLIWFLFAMSVFYLAKRVIGDLDEDRQVNYVPPIFKERGRLITHSYSVSRKGRTRRFTLRK